MAVEASAEMAELAAENCAGRDVTVLHADAKAFLAAEDAEFTAVVLDPPRAAHGRRAVLPGAGSRAR